MLIAQASGKVIGYVKVKLEGQGSVVVDWEMGEGVYTTKRKSTPTFILAYVC